MESEQTEKYIFFWGHKEEKKEEITKSCLSQWYDCSFEIDGILYNTAEQYMMSQKALLFNDNGTNKKIMGVKDPKQYKKLGRQVKNFSSNLWDEKKFDIVVKGNLAKFSQNENLKQFLLNTKIKFLLKHLLMIKYGVLEWLKMIKIYILQINGKEKIF